MLPPHRGKVSCWTRVLQPLADALYAVAWREAGPPNHHDDKVDSDQ